jgi:hypothetical protein
VLRRGVALNCRPPRAGRCSVTVTAKGRTIARGSKSVAAGKTTPVYARLTKAGRRLLKSAKRVNASVKVRLPGGQLTTRPVTLKR